MATDSFDDSACYSFFRLAVSGIDRVSPDKVVLDCCMSVIELAFHFYVTLRWLLGREYKIQGCPRLPAVEEFRLTTLWKSGAWCRPIRQQDCI